MWASLDPWLKPARPDVSACRLPVPGPPPRRPILDAILAFPLRSTSGSELAAWAPGLRSRCRRPLGGVSEPARPLSPPPGWR